jgi:adenylate cyclase
VAVFALANSDVTRTEMAVTALALAGVALFVGFFAVVLAARAASDPVVSVRDALAKVERGDLDVEVPVYDASEVGLLQAGFNRMVEGLRERRRIRELLGAYVDHDVAEHILEEGVSLEGEELEVTLMFLDVRDFTAWAERTDPREVVERLNGLFELVVPIVHERRGHVDKFVGDGCSPCSARRAATTSTPTRRSGRRSRSTAPCAATATAPRSSRSASA